MANQDTLTFGGIGKDPSGAYDQIEAGWDGTIASGENKFLPASSGNMALTVVADTGDVLQTETKAASGAGWTEANPDTYAIQNVPAGSTVATDYLSMVVTGNTGSAGNGTFVLADSEIASISSAGLITFAAGTGVFVTECTMVISYKADIDEPAETVTGTPLSVVGLDNITLYAPASPNAEIEGCWQWTADDVPTSGTDSSATWTNFYALQASAKAATVFAVGTKRFVRFKVVSTDADVDGVVEAQTTYAHASSGCYVSHTVGNDTSTNKPIVALGTETTAGSIGGIGVDPS
tara:strand:- start:84 stop:959 length:876 start_codon:yes stop_codon:yes gene_type:complete